MSNKYIVYFPIYTVQNKNDKIKKWHILEN